MPKFRKRPPVKANLVEEQAERVGEDFLLVASSLEAETVIPVAVCLIGIMDCLFVVVGIGDRPALLDLDKELHAGPRASGQVGGSKFAQDSRYGLESFFHGCHLQGS